MSRCTCGNRDAWRVVHYHAYAHHFNKKSYAVRECKSSLVRCDRCGAEWRTSAKYVDSLPGAMDFGGDPFYTKEVVSVANYKVKKSVGNKGSD